MHFHSQRRAARVRSPAPSHLPPVPHRVPSSQFLQAPSPQPPAPSRTESPMCARFPRIELGSCAHTGDSAVTAGAAGPGSLAAGQRAATLPAMRFEVRATSFSSGPWPTARCHATARRPNTATCIQNQNPGCRS